MSQQRPDSQRPGPGQQPGPRGPAPQGAGAAQAYAPADQVLRGGPGGPLPGLQGPQPGVQVQPAPPAQPSNRPAQQLVTGQPAGPVTGPAVARNTPRLLAVLMIISVAASIIAGTIGSWQLISAYRASTAATASVAQVIRIQNIQTNLLQADAIATNGFLVGGLEPEQQANAYDAAIATVTQQIAQAAEAQPADRDALAALNTAVVDYTGQIELARANNRQGYPIGATYQAQASASLRTTAMPILDNLADYNIERSTRGLLTYRPTLFVVFGLLCVALLLLACILAAIRFRRVVNIGLSLALVLVLAAVIIGGVGLSVRVNRGQDISTGSFAQALALSTAKIRGNDAKAYESLTLIARGSGAPYETAWAASAAQVSKTLTNSPATARAWDGYVAAHKALRTSDDSGNWDGAVASSIGNGAANTAFNTFDQQATTALAAANTGATQDLRSSRSGTIPLSILVALLATAAAVLSAWGLSRRLREYQ